METTGKTALIIALVVAALLLLLFGGGAFFLFVAAVFTLVYMSFNGHDDESSFGGFGDKIGVVDLVDIEELNARAFEARRAEHLADARFNTTPLFGWQLANPRALPQPRVIRGKCDCHWSTFRAASTTAPAVMPNPR